jgi:hypothetical protein
VKDSNARRISSGSKVIHWRNELFSGSLKAMTLIY